MDHPPSISIEEHDANGGLKAWCFHSLAHDMHRPDCDAREKDGLACGCETSSGRMPSLLTDSSPFWRSIRSLTDLKCDLAGLDSLLPPNWRTARRRRDHLLNGREYPLHFLPC